MYKTNARVYLFCGGRVSYFFFVEMQEIRCRLVTK